MLREELIAFAQKEYNAVVEHPFRTSPDSVVLRHKDNQKWYALFLYVKRSSLGLETLRSTTLKSADLDAEAFEGDGEEYVDILDIKVDPFMLNLLTGQPGYLPGYHMNKKNWMTVLLDGTVPFENIRTLLESSYGLTASSKTKRKSQRFGPKSWITPSNPKYYDVIAAFEETEIITWNQSGDFRVGDTVYMYVGAPYSSIMFRCKVIETDIPYPHKHPHINIKQLMKIQLSGKIEANVFSFARMKEEFGVYAVRGPRSIPNSLKEEIDLYLEATI